MVFQVRVASQQKGVNLPADSTVEKVLAEARKQGLKLPTDLQRVNVRGYISGNPFNLSDKAPTNDVLDCSIEPLTDR